jgi:hypothetical protein
MKGYKTILVGIVSFAIYALGWEPLVELVDPQYIALIGSTLMILLRLLTSTPIFKK